MLARSLVVIIGLVCFFLPREGRAELAPGLLQRITVGSEEDVRTSRGVSLFVPAGEAVSPFLPAGAFKMRWEGKLVLEKRSRLIFTLEGTGKARLIVDGEELVGALGESNDSERLRSGEHEFVVEYEAPASGNARLQLFWQGRDFTREPISNAVLKHEASDAGLTKHAPVRQGRQVLAEKRCLACHSGPEAVKMIELSLAGPSLNQVEHRLERDWLARWIADPQALRPSAHMPVAFKENAAQKAADIAAFLTAGAPKVDRVIKVDPEAVRKGGHLFHEQGCIACHSLDAKGDLERVALGGVSAKFRYGALASFLREPAKFHQGTRMPTFGFSEEEAEQLEVFLRSLNKEKAKPAPVGDAVSGKALFASVGCANCHEHGESDLLKAKTPLTALGGTDCSHVSYPLAESEQGALKSFLANKKAHASLQRSVPAEFAHRQYRSLNCNACHSQEGSETLRSKFLAETDAFKPPAPALDEEKPALKAGAPPLDYLGLKLLPEWREKLFAGAHPKKVRPWMAARMPAFPSRATPLSDGFSHLAGMPANSPKEAAADPAHLAIGKAMIAVDGGLACGTCHGIGDTKAIAVFEGEGPNLRDSGRRLTLEYFHLWMNDPPRLWPGTIMPKYATDGRTPLTQHFDGEAAKQYQAILQYLRSLSNK